MNFTFDDIISGDRFKEISDFEYLPNKELPDKDCIIFTKTDYLNELIPKIESKNGVNYKLISHNSDGNIVRENARSFDFKYSGTFPRNVSKWFAQNSQIFDEPRLQSIPIGLENDYNYLAKEKKQWILEPINNGDIYKPREKLLYINLNVGTNKEREIPYQIFKTDDKYTVEAGKNGQGFLNYRNQILNHRFVLCVEGGGKMCHRELETCYLNSIPVVKKGIYSEEMVELFNMLEFENYEELKLFLEDFKHSKITKTFDYCKPYLKFSFWKDLILNR